mmetsp:Transcript_55416/g.124555  ORF Transcript_55416/g.124555 Transcript_55416/m.124555 type:complete len:384 (+) Transcript_55416:91-1242(+)
MKDAHVDTSALKAVVFGGLGQLGQRFVRIAQACPNFHSIIIADVRSPPHVENGIDSTKVSFVVHRLGEDPVSDLVTLLQGVDCVFSAVTAPLNQATAQEFYRSNVDGIQELVEACKQAKSVRGLVYLSSIAVTNSARSKVNAKESDPLPALDEYENLYDKTKRLGEDLVLAADERGRLRTCALRPCGILISPRDSCFGNFLGHLPGLVIAPASPDPPMDFIDVDDLCHCMVLAGSKIVKEPDVIGGQAFFVSIGDTVSAKRLGEITAERIGWTFCALPVPLHSGLVVLMRWMYNCRKALGLPVKGVPDHIFWTFYRSELTCNNSKVRDLLGFTSSVPLLESVDRVVEQYCSERSFWKSPPVFWSLLLLPTACATYFMAGRLKK